MSGPYVPGNGLNSFPNTLPPVVNPGPPLSGSGSPEGIVPANPGTIYTDNDTSRTWVKVSGVAEQGWQLDPG